MALGAMLLAVGLLTARPLFGLIASPTQTEWLQPSVVDIGFVHGMRQHHLQALQMAQMVRGRVSPEADQMAFNILVNQNREVGLMEGWLVGKDLPVLSTEAPMTWVESVSHPASPEDALYAAQCRALQGSMPGLATAEELFQLSELQGAQLEKHFLSLMKAHHRAALPMAGFAMRNAKMPWVRQTAQLIAQDQRSELAWIEQRLNQIK